MSSKKQNPKASKATAAANPAADASGPKTDAPDFCTIFADDQQALEKKLRTDLPEPEIRDLQGRAGEALEAEKLYADAAVCFADSGDAESGLRLIEAHGSKMLQEGRFQTVLRAFEMMDSAAYAARPRALLVLGEIHDTQCRLPAREQAR